jgi:predicted TIM-barrel fold metal-dependent hydrolase
MNDGRWERTIIIGVVTGNLIILLIFFLVPRVQFILAHGGLTPSQLMETPGSRDMPNQLSQTYAVVNRIRELTAEDATIFMPPGNRTQGSFRSATIQILYPRKIFFGDDTNFEKELKEAENFKVSYFVYSKEWKPGYCGELSRIELTDFGFGMCRLNP